MKAYQYCGYCGHKREGAISTEMKCDNCGNITYRNALTVPVVIIPLDQSVVLVKRGIRPGYGKWALPGGFQVAGETWQEAGAREVLEETGLVVDPASFKLLSMTTVTNGNNLLFCESAPLAMTQTEFVEHLLNFQPDHETLDIGVFNTPFELAFPTHTEALELYFNKLHGNP